nr:sensor histidine kinase [Actinoplanes subtropicus]
MRPPRTLAFQVLLGVLSILLVTTAFGGFLYVTLSDQSLDKQTEGQALGIAETVAQMPDVRAALLAGDPRGLIQRRAEEVRGATAAAYVVVADRNGIRFSHPTTSLIGRRLEEPVIVLDGRTHTGTDPGSLGRSANGKAPIFDDGRVVGEVSVGILETHVASQVHHQVLAILTYSALALAVGILASWLLVWQIKRVTFGLEPAEIGSLLQEREAMLHGIREGVIGFDAKGRVDLINSEAQRLLHLPPGQRGRHLDDLLPAGRLRDLLAGTVTGDDQMVLTDEYLLVVNRMPVVLDGRDVGSVVTLRDRTEMEALVRELRSVNGLTTALRAQEHEFANRLHVMSGLLEMGEQEEAADYLAEISAGSLARADDIRARIAPPAVAALLLAKTTVAAEQNVRLTITDDSHLDQPGVDVRALLTVVGNLVDNAIEALGRLPGTREITLEIKDEDGVRVVVTDNGPGIASTHVDDIFQDGYSTKATGSGGRRGLGLALVHRIVHRAGGTIEVSCAGGTRFEVRLPVPAAPPAAPPAPSPVAAPASSPDAQPVAPPAAQPVAAPAAQPVAAPAAQPVAPPAAQPVAPPAAQPVAPPAAQPVAPRPAPPSRPIRPTCCCSTSTCPTRTACPCCARCTPPPARRTASSSAPPATCRWSARPCRWAPSTTWSSRSVSTSCATSWRRTAGGATGPVPRAWPTRRPSTACTACCAARPPRSRPGATSPPPRRRSWTWCDRPRSRWAPPRSPRSWARAGPRCSATWPSSNARE